MRLDARHHLSSGCGAAAPGAARWFQLYRYRDDAVTQSLVEQALEGGYTALVLTVDAPVPGRRERDLRSGFTIPPELTVPSLEAVLGGPVRGSDERALLADQRLGCLA